MARVSKPGPLHEVHLELGATLTSFGGFEMPLRYDSDLAEHHVVREHAGVFDLSHMGEIEVRGPAAGEALDRALVGAFSVLPVGRARYSLLCDEAGGVIDDLVGYRLGDENYLLVVNAVNTAPVHAALRERCDQPGVKVVDASRTTALIAVQGPASTQVLAGITEVDPGSLRSYSGLETHVAGVRVLLARTGYTGEDGFELFCGERDAARLWWAVLEAGAGNGLRPCGLAARDTLRLEAGMPLYGQELTRERTPYEAGLGRLVHLDKETTFVGRAALEERSRSAPVERLVGLVGSGRRAPRHGYEVRDGDGRRVGAVTSGALSPTLGVPIAMAYLERGATSPATALEVDVRGRLLPVQLVELPFYRRG